MVEVKLKKIGPVKFEATNSLGKFAILDGPAKIGGGDDGIRPMEMILMGLGGCSSFDVMSILTKSRQEVDDLDVSVKGERTDTVPAVYTSIHVHFTAKGKVSQKHLEKACKLSVEKYCSVVDMLKHSVEITHSCEVV